MATVALLSSLFNTTAGNKTTAGAVTTVGDLIVVIASSSGLAGGTAAVTDNNTDLRGTYVQVDQDRTGFSTTGVLTIWVRNALIGAAVSTTFTATQAGSTGGGLIVYRVTGMSIVGLQAVRRIDDNSWNTGGQSAGGAGTTPAPVLADTPLTANPIIAAVSNGTNPAGLAPRAGYTEAPTPDLGYNTPATGLQAMFLNSGETSATITYGGTSASAFASVAIELDASVPQYDWVGDTKVDSDRIISTRNAGRRAVWCVKRAWSKRPSGIFVPDHGLWVPAGVR